MAAEEPKDNGAQSGPEKRSRPAGGRAPTLPFGGTETVRFDGSDGEDPEQHERTTSVSPDEAPSELGDRILKRMADQPASAADPLIGVEIAGRFTVVERIGEGGMGAVYRARQRGMDRDVAIKVLLPQLGTNVTVVRRFHLEALAVSKLRHPNTIQIYDFGETEQGQLYIAMEFLDGLPLHEVLAAAQVLSCRRALKVAIQIARSLREAHDKGIVHRDLKPDNVYLVTVGEETDFVKVLDFGVAKLREVDPGQGTLTQSGTIFGTPKYMSPEQARAAGVDARSDIYAIGVMLFEMLTGRVPFAGESHLETLIKHIQEDPPALADVRPGLVYPGQVQRLVSRLLAKEAGDRPQTAEAFVREAEAVLAGLDDIYRNPVTAEDAVRAGIDIALSPRTRHDTRMDELPPDATMPGTTGETLVGETLDGGRRRGRAALVVAGVAALVVLGGLGAVWASLRALPPEVRAWSQLEAARVDEVPVVEPERVRIAIGSEPSEAEVWRGGQLLGETPYVVEARKGQQPISYTLKKDGRQEQSRTLEFDRDQSVTVQLPAIEPPKPLVVEVAAEPAPETSRRPPPGKARRPERPAAATPAPTTPRAVDGVKRPPPGADPYGARKADELKRRGL